MRLKLMVSELRGRDMAVARLYEEKMRLLGELLEEAEGGETEQTLALQQVRYLHLVQPELGGPELGKPESREIVMGKLQQAQRIAARMVSKELVCGGEGGESKVARSVSSVGEKHSQGYESPTLPRRAETSGGFDISQSVETEKLAALDESGEASLSHFPLPPPPTASGCGAGGVPGLLSGGSGGRGDQQP